jgi:diadenosine tetraphosphate (Ap4A) HIT family hydrolase
MTDWKNNRILSAISGTNPMVIKELPGSYAVIGDTQFLPGYCVLLPKKEVGSLNELDLNERNAFLNDMSILGDAIIQTVNPVRLNYEILGNGDHFLHAHIFPRYSWEAQEMQRMPVWLYDISNWQDANKAFKEEHGHLRTSIKNYLDTYYSQSAKSAF